MQLNKYISISGISSRRKSVLLIQEGRVSVNNRVIHNPAYRVTDNDTVIVDGSVIKAQEKKVYILLNKPKNYITTLFDEKNRSTVIDLIRPAIKERLYPIGRLDRDTTGLLLLTNDGDFSQKLSHPRYETEKIYHVVVDKPMYKATLEYIRKGVKLTDGFMQVDDISHVYDAPRTNIVLRLHSGKNRIVRRLFESLGYQIKKLDRIGYAGLTKDRLALGKWRFLSLEEVRALKGL